MTFQTILAPKRLLFYNGKVIWKDYPGQSESSLKLESGITVDKGDTTDKTSPLSENPRPKDSEINPEQSKSVKSDIRTPTSRSIETNLSNIKNAETKHKDIDLRSKLDNTWNKYQSVKRKLNSSDLNVSLDNTDPYRSNVSFESNRSTDSNESIQITVKKDSRQYMHKCSNTLQLKRKPASEFFNTDLDTSVNYSDLDSSFDQENDTHKQTVERVNRRVKKMKINESDKQSWEQLISPEEDEDVYYQLMMLNMEETDDHSRVNKISSRKCRVCGETERNLKRHTIYEHLTDVWWGVMGDATCWKCQAYHSLPDIRHCDGYYVPQKGFQKSYHEAQRFF